ncbi:PilW family protein [Delftia sp. PS-11]|uniref:PilW family protein n=1 Tax=Delftia sp. PS-11 TaxID=2767222 RepID=UPI0024572D7E|nr:PilW family protein [Delftia sp. PS-11]KAJ8740880.1 PilW family protein [Delftia sp. PS-11]
MTHATHAYRQRLHMQGQRGLTLIELLVAVTLSMLIALAAAAALVVARQGFSNVDAASQLRDNGRFVQDLLQRLGAQAGFKSLQYAATAKPASTIGVTSSPVPNIYGINNASRADTDAWNVGTTRTSGTVGYGSDILVLRYQNSASTMGMGNAGVDAAAAAAAAASSAGTTSTVKGDEGDQTMIDCSGQSTTIFPEDRDQRILSILHVGTGSDGEPALMCTYIKPDGSTPSTPLVQGVENFQVLYGVDGIGPGNTAALSPSTADSVPDRYLRADQLTIANNTAATYANWQRVRSLRIGMVLRGPLGSAVDSSSQTLYPLGLAKSASNGTAGSAFASTNDPGTTHSPAADSRLRQVVTFTIHLRNSQGDL